MRRYLLVGLPVYVLGLMLLAPASLLTWGIGRWAGGKVQMVNASGSLWNGRMERLQISLPDVGPVALDDVHWRLRPDRLLWGATPIHVENRAGDLVMHTDVGLLRDGVRLADARIELPLARFSGAILSPVAKGLRGDLVMDSDAIRLARPYRGSAQGELRVTAGKLPAGTYSIDIKGEGPKLTFRWNGPKGPRAMSGGGWWDGTLHLDGVPGAISR